MLKKWMERQMESMGREVIDEESNRYRHSKRMQQKDIERKDLTDESVLTSFQAW